ncbi:ABC transporter ATP-binding protein [Candidatus Bathyarchaeota archaeon]|nr:ABC transporter ATP-binding protein [Candidatus Bathyarchaeota archaeon]MBS7627857.1 ABC transporter ATP-binding protein [Candidatus Bathyarchaeota archaeon]
MDFVIETKELTKVYKSEGKDVLAVDHLNLNVEGGSILGLLGPNGAGKTTFIMMLTGLTLPTSGTAKVLGYDIIKESREIRKKVGLLPEGFGFYDHLTAPQNLDYIAALNDIPKAERVKRIDEALSLVGLQDVKDRKVGGFSRGMKQRLGIAQALLKNPELLIFDEPTVGLDPEGSRAFKDLVLRLNKDGKTVILSTHLLFEVGPLCHSIVVMNRGKAVVQGRVRELMEKLMAEEGYRIRIEGKGNLGTFADALRGLKEVKEIKLEDRGILLKAISDISLQIGRMASNYGVEVSTLRVEEPTLEDLFMKYYRKEGISIG